MDRLLSWKRILDLAGLTALSFALFVSSTPGEQAAAQALDVAARRQVAPAVISPEEGSTWVPGTDKALLREIAQAAREVKGRLSKLAANKRTVTVGSFTCPTNTNATGALLRYLLTQQLKKAGVRVASSGVVGLSGKYRNVSDTDSGMTTVKITFDLEDEEGEKVGNPFSHVVMSERVTADLFGTTTPLVFSSRLKRNQTLARSIRESTVALEGSRVTSRRGSKFGIQVLAADAPADEDADLSRVRYAPLRTTNKDGLAFVGFRPKQFYAVRVLNGSDADIAVTLSIDGLSLFTLSESAAKTGLPAESHLLVPARSHVVIRGWFLNNQKTALFQTTGFSGSVAKAKGGSVADVGTITATFSACPKPAPPPEEDSGAIGSAPKSKKKADSDEPAATGKGPTITSTYRRVERNVGAIVDTISVRYAWASKSTRPATKSKE